MTSNAKRVVIVTRVSGESQRENTSHELQFDACERHAKSHGWEVVRAFAETESGMGYHARTQTQQALEMLEKDAADVLLFYRVDRYGRDEEFQQRMLKRIVGARKQLQFATLPLEYDAESGELTPESHYMLTTFGGTGALEGRIIRMRLREGKRRKIEQGIQVARRHSPWGFHIVTHADVTRGSNAKIGTVTPPMIGCYVPVVAELELARRLIFHPRLAGASSVEIAEGLNRAGVLPPRGGAQWNPSTVLGILRHPVYRGLRFYRKTRSQRDEARLDVGLAQTFVRPREAQEWVTLGDNPTQAALFQNVAALLLSDVEARAIDRSLENTASASGPRDRKYPLTGLLLCPGCGGHMHGYHQKQLKRTTPKGNPSRAKPFERFTYQCSKRGRWRAAPCVAPIFAATAVEAMLACALSHLCEGKALRAAVAAVESERRYREGASRDGASEAGQGGDRERRARQLERQLGEIQRRATLAADEKITARFNGQPTGAFETILSRLFEQEARLRTDLDALLVQEAPTRLPDVPALETDLRALVTLLRNPDIPGAAKNKALLLLVEPLEIQPRSERVYGFLGVPVALQGALRTEGDYRVSFRVREIALVGRTPQWDVDVQLET